VLSSAAALLDGLFEHPEVIQFPTPYGIAHRILRIHRVFPQPAKGIGAMFYHLAEEKTTGNLVVLLLAERAR